jgi:hypothetical protein
VCSSKRRAAQIVGPQLRFAYGFAAPCGHGPIIGTSRSRNRLFIDTKVLMKKTFQLKVEGKNRDRLLEAAKHDIRKYMKRERAKALPKGVDYWDFDCKSGYSEATAAVVPVADLIKSIDEIVKDGGEQFYVEVLAKGGVKVARVRNEGEDDFMDDA